jgi:hypothetical protein
MKGMKNLAMLYALAAMSDMGSIPKGRPYIEPKEKKEPPIPKGCKVYYFTDSGEISETPTKHKVIALNEKNALKKFKSTP